MNRRQFLAASAAIASSTAVAIPDEKTTDGGLADVSWPTRHQKRRPVLPPGAHSVAHFANRCVGCGLCTAVCPSQCLRHSTDPGRIGRVELDFRHGWCKPGCTKCSEVCPAGALNHVDPGMKRLFRVGQAVWNRASFIRTTEGVDCHACEKHCPVRAVKLVGGFPVVDRAVCIGCGACEHYCPARPLTAIRVEGFEQHREITPISEDDLLSELRRIIDDGHSAVVARAGVIVLTLEGHGLKPIQDAIAADEGVFTNAIVADKVVGIGAARIYVQGGASKVYGKVMSEGAKKLLEENGIVATCANLVPQLECEKGR